MLASGTRLSLDLSLVDGKRKAETETSVLFCSYVTSHEWLSLGVRFIYNRIRVTNQTQTAWTQIILLFFYCFQCLFGMQANNRCDSKKKKKPSGRCSCRYWRAVCYYCALLQFPYLQVDEEENSGTLKALLPSSCKCQALCSASPHWCHGTNNGPMRRQHRPQPSSAHLETFWYNSDLI